MQQPASNAEQNSSAISTTSKKETKRHRLLMNLDVVLLCVLIVGVWSLLSLPVIFYHLQESEVSSNTSSNRTVSGDSVCSAPLKYATTNGVCLTELNNILTSSNCLPDPEGNVLVVRNDEATATQLLNGLSSLGASAECRRKAVPFLCQYLFGLCSGSGVSIQPTSSQCEELRDTLCRREWMIILKLNMDIPDCAIFPPRALSCPALNDSHSTNGTVLKNVSDIPQSLLNETTDEVLECTQGFYQENNSNVCTPSCLTYTQYRKRLSTFLDIVSFTSAISAFLGAIMVLVISCLLHKRMFIFPSIFILYIMIDILVYAFIVMVGHVGRNELFCSSRSLIESLKEVTPFCVISGILPLYVIFQLALWWLFHITLLLWKVVFPLQARLSGKIVKYIHLTCAILGILFPLAPVITSMVDFAVDLQKLNENSTSQLRSRLFFSGGLGFGSTRFPTLMCQATDPDAIFYSYILLVDIIVACGCTMLLIIVWSLHRLYKRNRDQKGVQFKFGMAEKKLLFVFCYYVVLSVIFLIAQTLSARNATQQTGNFQKYFLCEQGGHNPSNPCSRSEIEDLSYPLLEVLSNFLQALFPFVNLVYVVNVQELKTFWREKKDHITSFYRQSYPSI